MIHGLQMEAIEIIFIECIHFPSIEAQHLDGYKNWPEN